MVWESFFFFSVYAFVLVAFLIDISIFNPKNLIHKVSKGLLPYASRTIHQVFFVYG